MTNIESDIMPIGKSAQDLYAQLLNFESFGSMMPENVQKFESDNNSFLFQLKGAPEVRLVVDEMKEPTLISFKSASSKLDFTLACHIEEIDESNCKAGFKFNGQFNMMMKMMIEKPLTTFIEKLADKLKDI